MKTQITLILNPTELKEAATKYFENKNKDAEVTIIVEEEQNQKQYGYWDIENLNPDLWGKSKKIQNIKEFRERTRKLTGKACGLPYAKLAIENWIEFIVEFQSMYCFPTTFKNINF